MREYNSEADDGQTEEMGGRGSGSWEPGSRGAGERENGRVFTIRNLSPLPLSLRSRSRLPNGNLRSQVGQLLAAFSEMFDEVASEQ